jgi:hypothetical protein
MVGIPASAARSPLLHSAPTYGHADIRIDLDRVVDATLRFTGSEIAALIPEALFTAFADGEREIATEDIPRGRQSPCRRQARRWLSALAVCGHGLTGVPVLR